MVPSPRHDDHERKPCARLRSQPFVNKYNGLRRSPPMARNASVLKKTSAILKRQDHQGTASSTFRAQEVVFASLASSAMTFLTARQVSGRRS
jgi:hypothetical protein